MTGCFCLQIGNLDGYYHFQLAEFNSSIHGEMLARNYLDTSPDLASQGKSINISSLWMSLGAVLQKLQYELTHALNREQHVSLRVSDTFLS